MDYASSTHSNTMMMNKPTASAKWSAWREYRDKVHAAYGELLRRDRELRETEDVIIRRLRAYRLEKLVRDFLAKYNHFPRHAR